MIIFGNESKEKQKQKKKRQKKEFNKIVQSFRIVKMKELN